MKLLLEFGLPSELEEDYKKLDQDGKKAFMKQLTEEFTEFLTEELTEVNDLKVTNIEDELLGDHE